MKSVNRHSSFVVRFPILFIGMILFLISCKKSEVLNDEEMTYVKTTISLSKIRGEAQDSVALLHKQDSIYRLYKTSKTDYKTKTVSYADDAERAAIVFRAINDSLNVR